MKKHFISKLLILPIIGISLASCGSNNPQESSSQTKVINSYEVSFSYPNGSVTKVSVNEGEKLTKPANPEKPLNEFVGWATDISLNNLFDFNSAINSNITLYPKFKFIGNESYQELVKLDAVDNFSYGGVISSMLPNFKEYENTDSYVKVSTVDELIWAIKNAKLDYETTWDDEINYYTQKLNKDSKVKVIEILNDLDLGYNKLSATALSSGIVENFSKSQQTKIDNDTLGILMSDMVKESGISQIKIEGISDLLIYSKNGAKLTHGGFKLTSDNNLVIRNLEFDELWQWEDSSLESPGYVIGDYDVFGWAYFKIAFCGAIWIDHCTFGKSYDGQIDVSNPDYVTNIYKYDSEGKVVIDKNGNKSRDKYTFTRAPYGANGLCEVHISNCNFNSGSDDENGYLYKMMEKIEESYQNGENKYLYYKTLRDNYNLSFEEILYGLAIPQKKGFLCGDREDLESYNEKLYVSFGNCYFKNIEDRLPKVRGGFAYIYNSIIDSKTYQDYREIIKTKGAKSINTINSKYKCALVSQGLVCGTNGDTLFDNVIIKGVEAVVKNNDSGTFGGFNFQNVRILFKDKVLEGSSPSLSLGSFNASGMSITYDKYDSHNKEIAYLENNLDNLEAKFVSGYYGTNKNIGDLFLYTNIKDYEDENK